MNLYFDGANVNDNPVADFEHRHVLNLLPWWVNGTLSARERVRVRQHIDQCASCRHEIEFLKRCDQAVREVSPNVPDVNDALASVMQRIDTSAACYRNAFDGKSTDIQGTVVNRGIDHCKHSIAPTNTRQWFGAAAAVVVLMILLASFRTDLPLSEQSGEYSVLSSPDATDTAVQIMVSFSDDEIAANALTVLRDELDTPDVIRAWELSEGASGVLTIDGSIEPMNLIDVLGSINNTDKVTHVEMLSR